MIPSLRPAGPIGRLGGGCVLFFQAQIPGDLPEGGIFAGNETADLGRASDHRLLALFSQEFDVTRLGGPLAECLFKGFEDGRRQPLGGDDRPPENRLFLGDS